MKKIVLMVVALLSISFVQAQSVVENYNEASKAVQAKDFVKCFTWIFGRDLDVVGVNGRFCCLFSLDIIRRI